MSALGYVRCRPRRRCQVTRLSCSNIAHAALIARTYENAAKTKLIATHCVCCGRPLCDAQSVETGVGPICGRKYGYDKCDRDADFQRAIVSSKTAGCYDSVAALVANSDARSACNVLTHLLAADPENKRRDHIIDAIRYLGFSKLAERLKDRLTGSRGELTVAVDGQYLLVSSVNLSGDMFTALLTEFRSVPGRRWMPELRSNRFPASSKSQLWRAMCRAAAGCRLVSDKGESTIPAIEHTALVA